MGDLNSRTPAVRQNLCDNVAGALFILVLPLGYFLLILRRNRWSVRETTAIEYVAALGALAFWLVLYVSTGGGVTSWISASVGILATLIPIMPGAPIIEENDIFTRVVYSIVFVWFANYAGISIASNIGGFPEVDYCSGQFNLVAMSSALYAIIMYKSIPISTKKPALLDGLISRKESQSQEVEISSILLTFTPILLVLPFFNGDFPNYITYLWCLIFN